MNPPTESHHAKPREVKLERKLDVLIDQIDEFYNSDWSSVTTLTNLTIRLVQASHVATELLEIYRGDESLKPVCNHQNESLEG